MQPTETDVFIENGITRVSSKITIEPELKKKHKHRTNRTVRHDICVSVSRSREYRTILLLSSIS